METDNKIARLVFMLGFVQGTLHRVDELLRPLADAEDETYSEQAGDLLRVTYEIQIAIEKLVGEI